MAGLSPLFLPALYPDEANASWSTPQNPQMTRDQLLAVTNSYADAVGSSGADSVMNHPDCRRTENGITFPLRCTFAFDLLDAPVYVRRWVVDTTMNTVVGAYYFGGGTGALFTHE